MSGSAKLSYKETTDWLFSQLPMYQRVGQAAYRKDLYNIKILSEHLNHPEHQFKSIHVGGTNGKGSCSHMLASILQEAGYKVGLYTSPHLKDFRERIRINGQVILQEAVVNFVDKNKSFFEENKLSFFEMTVGLAFKTFAEKKVDIAIIEVGMGGRLDATNIISPELSIITNIGFDHVQFLGDTLPKIAREKAGIIKRQTPVIIGETHTQTKSVFEEVARHQNAEIYFADEENCKPLDTDLKGLYQIKNQKTVLKAIEILRTIGWTLSGEHLEKGLLKVIENTGLKGRWQSIGDKPTVIADTAHNLEGLRYVTEQLMRLKFETLHMVMGFVNDKDITAIFELLPKQAKYYLSTPDIARAKPIEELKANLEDCNINSLYFLTLKEAFEAAKKDSTSKDLIFVGGSIFTVAELLPD